MSDEEQIDKPTMSLAIRKAECAQCGGQRNCTVRGSFKKTYNEDGFWGETTWFILECRGCDHVFAQTVSINSEEYEQWYNLDGSEGGCHVETVNYWPSLSKRPRPEWMTEYGVEADDVGALNGALSELYDALNADLRLLSAIGIRTCFDIASELLKVDPAQTFAEKLDALVNAKHIRLLDRDRLETAVEVGNATAHRGWKPKPSDLDAMMNVLEDFIFGAFVQPHRRKKLDEEAAKVRVTVPPKPIRQKKAKAAAPAAPTQAP